MGCCKSKVGDSGESASETPPSSPPSAETVATQPTSISTQQGQVIPLSNASTADAVIAEQTLRQHDRPTSVVVKPSTPASLISRPQLVIGPVSSAALQPSTFQQQTTIPSPLSAFQQQSVIPNYSNQVVSYPWSAANFNQGSNNFFNASAADAPAARSSSRSSWNGAGRSKEEKNGERNVKKLCERLWDTAASDRLILNYDYKISGQPGGKFIRDVENRTPILNRSAFEQFAKLLDAYEEDEITTPNRTRAETKFLGALIQTPVMIKCKNLLINSNYYMSQGKNEPNWFHDELWRIWFKPRSLNNRENGGRSSFQHIFVGIEGDDELKGMHNWFQYYRLDQQGRITFRQHYNKNKKGSGILATIEFVLDNCLRKPKCSMFLGTTPELELALYTFLYFVHGQTSGREARDFDLRLDGKEIGITVCRKNDVYLTSAYPIDLD